MRLVLVATLLVGCSGGERAPAAAPRQTCTLFEGVSKQAPPGGGVPITVEVPAGWQRTDYQDGSCRFAPAQGPQVTIKLEFCGMDPCNARLDGGHVRATTDMKIAGQTLRTNTFRIQDSVTRYIVACRASVQGPQITPELDAQVKRAAAVCDTLAFTSP